MAAYSGITPKSRSFTAFRMTILGDERMGDRIAVESWPTLPYAIRSPTPAETSAPAGNPAEVLGTSRGHPTATRKPANQRTSVRQARAVD